MALCPTCRKVADASASFCAACGSRLEPGATAADVTMSGVTAEAPPPRRAPGTPVAPRLEAPGTGQGTSGGASPGSSNAGVLTSSSLDGGRFAPGEMVAGRYRVIARLGKGGMGEVYRADDVTLGQQVALKFLPPAFAADPDKVQRLLHEVRLTRQISHPNVCRVYDAVTLPPSYPGGAPTVFLAMEYIDGEDLASLLRRIGRLPGDKALEVARQVCAGLAAAHDLGVIHRDLKPSNIMLDGRGRARLTDFGVAGTAAEIAASGEIATGTPTYMAPEQLNGQDVSVRSDVYSLGLLLYEMFTGRAVYRASSMAELRGLHATMTPERPSTVVPDVDPLVERVILRCLEKDPAFRPSSALAVSAALPGGDPVAAALAAGETPTPEMVAASGGAGAWSARVGLSCVAAFFVGLLVLVALKDHFGMVTRTPFEYSGEVLRAKALELLKEHAPPPEGGDEAWGWSTNTQVIREIDQTLTTPERWESLTTGRPSGVLFWYRYSPEALTPHSNTMSIPGPGDPPVAGRASALVWLDSAGRLLHFTSQPQVAPRPNDPLAPPPKPARAEPDWDAFFEAARLDRSAFTEAEPRVTTLFATDRRRAWVGEWPANPPFSAIPIRVDAASFEGQPVVFRIIASWDTVATAPGSALRGLGELAAIGAYLFSVVAAPLLAWRHARSGRGDRRGALRLALFLFGTTLLMHALRNAVPARWMSVIGGQSLVFARSVWLGVFGWMLYMALEPYIRKAAPWAVVGWTRLIQGRFTDPAVGRDVLRGALVAVAFGIVYHASAYAPDMLGLPPPAPMSPNWNWLGGLRESLALVLQGCSNAVLIPMYMTVLMVGLRWALRSDRWAIVALWVLGTLLISSEYGFARYALVVSGIIALGYALALVRFGLLAMSATFLTSFLINSPPASLDLDAWYAPSWLFPYALVGAVVCFAAYTSIGGRAGVAALRMSAALGGVRSGGVR